MMTSCTSGETVGLCIRVECKRACRAAQHHTHPSLCLAFLSFAGVGWQRVGDIGRRGRLCKSIAPHDKPYTMPAGAFVDYLLSTYSADEIKVLLWMMRARLDGKKLSIVLVPETTTSSKL